MYQETSPVMDVHKRVLIVEDEAVSRKALTMLLRAAGYVTNAAASAEEALERIEDERPQILLVDLDLPGMNGIEFIALVSKTLPGVQAVLVTATSRERLDTYISGHAVQYIRKPIDLNALFAVMGPADPSEPV